MTGQHINLIYKRIQFHLRNNSRTFSAFTCVCLTLVCLACVSGCGKGGATEISSISITPTSASVGIGETTEFTATVNLTNTTTTSSVSTVVTWEVNGVAGGNDSTGTIVSLSTDEQIGVYRAPAAVPTTNNGQVNITAVAQQTNSTSTSVTSTSTTTSGEVTSNTAVVTVGTSTTGVSVSPTETTVGAGGTFQFSALNNGLPDVNAVWSVSSANGGTIGSIDAHSGIYTAPLYPPPGGIVTISAMDGSTTATSTVTIAYSDHTLNGPYAFSFTGNDSLGFSAFAGSFVADGSGHIVSGVEDTESFATGVFTQIPITGTYVVGQDGRTTVLINGNSTWQFALTTNQHALLIRFDSHATGSGTIDQQNLSDLTNSLSVISGPYAFSALGSDTAFAPLGMAGAFSASGGVISATGSILDVNDNSTVTTGDTSLNGSYSFDSSFPGTGRGTLTLTSTTTGSRQYSFYLVDNTHLHIIETDRVAFVAGDIYSAATGASFTAANLTNANYVFTAGGKSSAGAYAKGGFLASAGTGSILDTNNAGTAGLNASATSCPVNASSATGRTDLKLFTGSATCPSGTAAGEFAMYQTSFAQGLALMLEIDSSAVSTGVAYQQPASPTVFTAGSFAFELAGQGIFHNVLASYLPVVEGQVTIAGTGATGNLDINNYSAVFTADPLNSTTSVLSAPVASGRGTVVVKATSPAVTYDLVYYLIDAKTALLFDQDTTLPAIGIIARGF